MHTSYRCDYRDGTRGPDVVVDGTAVADNSASPAHHVARWMPDKLVIKGRLQVRKAAKHVLECAHGKHRRVVVFTVTPRPGGDSNTRAYNSTNAYVAGQGRVLVAKLSRHHATVYVVPPVSELIHTGGTSRNAALAMRSAMEHGTCGGGTPVEFDEEVAHIVVAYKVRSG